MPDIKTIADNANIVVNGYAFTREEDGIHVLKPIMTQLSDKDHKAQMEDMKSFDEQMPCVGIFWYDPEDHSFFGVQ